MPSVIGVERRPTCCCGLVVSSPASPVSHSALPRPPNRMAFPPVPRLSLLLLLALAVLAGTAMVPLTDDAQTVPPRCDRKSGHCTEPMQRLQPVSGLFCDADAAKLHRQSLGQTRGRF